MLNRGDESGIFCSKNKAGQVTIFIIIAIIIVSGITIFFIVRGNLTGGAIPASIQPVYNSFLSCLSDKTSVGISVLESQAGYITLPEFKPGNSYMPFSSQLNFLGNPVPYWYYVSGNNIPTEQIPTKQDMEKSLAEFIDDKIRECSYENYYQQGFEIIQSEPTAGVTINNDNVAVNLNMNLKISYGNDTSLIQNHKATIKSNLGALYASAKIIYEKESKELFLENYGVDDLRLYAPVDGVEITCSPKTWNADDVFNKLKDAIEANTLALTSQTPKTAYEKYFFVNANINQNVRFINSKNWSSSFEVLPSDDNILTASPVGNQPGLGILGFCYVPYHFVYNIKYPVMIQVYNGDEIFQFPVAVVIQGNKQRTALNSSASSVASDLCPYKNTLETINTRDSNSNPVNSVISYECFGQTCEIGNASSGTLTANFPQCSNGYVIAKANGYKEKKYLYSTVQAGNADILMEKLYNISINLKLNGQNYNSPAMIYFASADDSKVISYPEHKSVQLGEGDYNVSVYIYKSSSITFPATTQKECTTIPASGIAGTFGLTEKKCVDIKIPSQLITNALAGGGKKSYYFSEEDLRNANTLQINAPELGIPATIEELQNNYLSFDSKELEVNLI
ncbi:Uncharacterised protein [uncultured archaeon]|nr:Uncharacterised protein [uncultured archaeon]